VLVVGHASGLTVDEIRHLIEDGTRVKFIDARDPIVWQAYSVKIPGAIRVSLDVSDEHVAAFPRDRRLIAYGTGDDTGRAADLARLLADRGFTASYLHGGFAAWVEAGLPVGPR
jgi:rhodanese-related sulfurtransferase